ncbi:MAG: cytochrome c biogenesis protein CcsA [Halobacteria archaeon]
MSSKSNSVLAAGLALCGLATAAALALLPPARTLGEAYRLFFFEFPSALLATGLFTFTLAGGLLFLRTGRLRWDRAAGASARLGLLFTLLTLAVGVLFARETWYEASGVFWTWQPIETATLAMGLAFAGYLALRASISDPRVRARAAAAWSTLAYLSVPLAYLSTRLFPTSLHPQSFSIGLEPAMWGVAGLMVAGLGLVCLWAVRFDVALQEQREEEG